jgi:ATP-dependent DNA helicase RecQ
VLRRCERAGVVDDELMAGVFAALKRWPWAERPTWVTWVPGAGGPAGGGLAAAVAEAVGAAGKLAVQPAFADFEFADGPGRSVGGNSSFRLARAWSGVTLSAPLPDEAGPVLVVFDRCDSRWTQTVAAHRLRAAGRGPVLPFALARV